MASKKQVTLNIERYDTDYFYITVALWIDGRWLVLWENKEVSEGDRLNLWDDHIRKAKTQDSPVLVEAVAVAVAASRLKANVKR